VVRARRWSYRVTYEIVGEDIWIYFIHPSSLPVTHSDLADGIH
jgi:hypothetical protein